jgi:hypothetical protein
VFGLMDHIADQEYEQASGLGPCLHFYFYMKTLLIKISLLAFLLPTTVYSANRCDALFGNASQKGTDLYRKYQEEQNEDHLFREGQVATHVYINNNKKKKPYFFFAMPEGNTGFGMWFKSSMNVGLKSASAPKAIIEGDMHGSEMEMATETKALKLDTTILGSMRFIRDRELFVKLAERIFGHKTRVEGNTIIMERRSFNRLINYSMKIEVLGDTEIIQDAGGIRLESKTKVRFKVTALTNEKPLNPVELEKLFQDDFLRTLTQEERDQISFLIYQEKLMAGSPRYQTKFGRDTLISLRVFMKHMKPEGLEMLIISSLSSTDPKTGRTSHEQHEGDITAWERMKKKVKMIGVKEPIEDRDVMIDDDIQMAFLTANYMQKYPERAKEFLDKKDGRGIPVRDLVRKNYEYVMKTSDAFAKKPVYKNLLRLVPGHATGQWRDSENGLGGGVYPFDVNAALVPGALRLLTEIYGNKDHEFYNKATAEYLRASSEVWSTKVIPLFMVKVPAGELKAAAQRYMDVLKFDMSKFAEPPAEGIEFPAIALREDGSHVRIMHTDDSMMGTYGHPPAKYLENMVKLLSTPFPYGLHTDAGLVIANAIFESAEWQAKFTPKNYHGLVSWGREENLLIFGISRQLERPDLSPNLRTDLKKLQQIIGKLVQKKGGVELVAIVQKDGKMTSEPFDGDALPNIDQFWNHLFVVSRQLLLGKP